MLNIKTHRDLSVDHHQEHFAMTISLTWLSHGSWLIETGGSRIVLDPFLTDNPKAKTTAKEIGKVSHVLVSHAHFDHINDVAEIVNGCDATLVAAFEVGQWFQKKHGVKNAVMMNPGGRTKLPWGEVLMTPAVHSSSFPDGSYGGNPTGFVLRTGEKRVYFACDTAFFSDMRHYAHGVDAAVLPVGDLYTMGIEESIAAIKLIEPKKVLPAHYGTWPPIEQDIDLWANRVRSETAAEPIVLAVDESAEV
jgi:L-ascorbate metabolism protein UlaG (beta-lactamase superfamily)